MKYLKTLLYFSIILNACNSSENDPSSEKSEVLITKFKPIIDGIWVEPTYIDDISKTKSPNKSQGLLAPMVELSIDSNKITGDSLEVGAPSIHEGSSFVVYFRLGTKQTSLPTNIAHYGSPTNFFELGYLVGNQDTTLIIYRFDKNKTLLEETKFLKVPKNSEGALQYMVNKTLFSGDYDASDTAGNKMKIHFTNDGLVQGLPNFEKYYVLTDFVAEPENKLDEVCFDIQTKNQKCYAYKIIGDTINLYETNENEDGPRPGPLKYRLVKQ